MNPAAIDVLQLVGEDLMATDQTTYEAIQQAIRQGARPQVLLTFGSEATISLGFRDDYERTRWVHTMPLQ